jgi:hypothetical protein
MKRTHHDARRIGMQPQRVVEQVEHSAPRQVRNPAVPPL